MLSYSVVCVTRNRRDYLRDCLASIRLQSAAPIDIVVFDNASEDGTVEMLEAEFPEVRIIRSHTNLGFFPALNIAIANARGDAVLTVDDDAYFKAPGDVARMLEALGREDVFIVTCNVEGPRERGHVEVDTYVHTFKTGFSLIRRTVFDELVGYYPDLFFRSAGEAYLATKVWDRGGKVVKLAGVEMYHHQAMTGRSQRDWDFYGQRSQILLVLMRDPAAVVPARLLSKFSKGLFGAIQRRKSVLRWAHSWLSALANAHHALKLRDPVSMSTFRHLQSLQSGNHRVGTDPVERAARPYVAVS